MQRKYDDHCFRLDSLSCELLISFSETGSLAALASKMKRDISVVSRQLQRLAQTQPVLEKKGGRWKITPLGQKLVHWSKDAIQSQTSLLLEQIRLTVGTSHEFAARVLVPGMAELFSGEIDVLPSILCAEGSVESLLLSGVIDYGFDCGRPESPFIKFKHARKEPLVLIASPRFIRTQKVRNWEELLGKPHLEYTRISAARVLDLPQELENRVARFSTIASTRSAAICGMGWAVLPSYTIQDELKNGELVSISTPKLLHEQFGVWWSRDNREIEKTWVPRALIWLRSRDLG